MEHVGGIYFDLAVRPVAHLVVEQRRFGIAADVHPLGMDRPQRDRPAAGEVSRSISA
jgi:hypothetical protein